MLKQHYLRWGVPLLITAIFFAVFLSYKGPEQQIFSQYNVNLFVLLLAAGFLTGVCWWVALDKRRYTRLINRIFQLATLNMMIIFLGLLTLSDLFVDLIPVVAWLPLLAGLIMLWMTLERPLGAGLQQIHIQELVNNVALVVGAVLISLIFSEVIFRYVLMENEVPVTNDEFEQLIASAWPRPIPRARDPDKFRILGLSDSFGGAGGPENYHYILETLYTDEGVAVEVVNFSRGGYDPIDQVALFKRFAASYQPDLILHGFFVGNDFEPSRKELQAFQRIVLRPATGLRAYRPHNFLLRRWFRNYMIVIRDNFQKASETASTSPVTSIDQSIVARTNLQKGSETASTPPVISTDQSMEVEAEIKPEITAPPSGGTFSEAEFLRIEKYRLNIYQPRQPPPVRWRKTMALINEIRAEAARIGSDYVMVIHPDQLQVEHEVILALEESYNLDLSGYDLALPQRFLIDHCAENNIKCLDLLPVFKERSDPLYLVRDTHYNDNGNRLAAEAIFDLLRDLALFPGPETKR